MKWRLILVLAVLAILAPAAASAVTLQEALLLAKPAVALVTAEVRAEVTLNCGSGTKTVRPAPFIETGTGWFVDGRGDLITNGHVVDPAIRVGDRDARIGDPVHIIGFPGVVLSHELLNKSATLEASVTNGAVSGYKQDAIGQDFIQTDAAAAHGNSGGPVVGDDAMLIGVLTATTLSGGSSGAILQGFNFVI